MDQHAVETAPVEPALPAIAEHPKLLTMLLMPVLNTPAGVKAAANALPTTKVVETSTPNSTTPTVLTMLVSGKSTHKTGHSAVVEKPPAMRPQISPVPRKFGVGEATPGNIGPPVVLAAAAEKHDLKFFIKNYRSKPSIYLFFSQ